MSDWWNKNWRSGWSKSWWKCYWSKSWCTHGFDTFFFLFGDSTKTQYSVASERVVWDTIGWFFSLYARPLLASGIIVDSGVDLAFHWEKPKKREHESLLVKKSWMRSCFAVPTWKLKWLEQPWLSYQCMDIINGDDVIIMTSSFCLCQLRQVVSDSFLENNFSLIAGAECCNTLYRQKNNNVSKSLHECNWFREDILTWGVTITSWMAKIWSKWVCWFQTILQSVLIMSKFLVRD